jgi:hypothetical protein
MAVAITFGTIFATQPSTTEMSYLDGNYNQISAALANLPTFSNYGVDTGAVNASVVTLTGCTNAYTDGVKIQFKMLNTTTAANPTLAVNGGAADVIVNSDQTVLYAGALKAGLIYEVIYSSTLGAWVLMNFLKQTSGFSIYATASQSSGVPFAGNSSVTQETGLNGYNATTGAFTAPFTGWYQFHLNAAINNSGGATQNYLFNIAAGSQQSINTGSFQIPAGSSHQFELGATVFLNQNQTVSLSASTGLSATLQLTINSTYAGYYLGP